VILSLKLRLQEAAVRLDVIDNEDARTHAVAGALGIRFSTARMKEAIWMGLER
jgi:hypothetical protein